MYVKNYIPFIIIGIILAIFGIIFHLQGQSVLGPESSFMYSNPEWIAYGFQIMLIGIILFCVGIILKLLKIIRQ